MLWKTSAFCTSQAKGGLYFHKFNAEGIFDHQMGEYKFTFSRTNVITSTLAKIL